MRRIYDAKRIKGLAFPCVAGNIKAHSAIISILIYEGIIKKNFLQASLLYDSVDNRRLKLALYLKKKV